MMVPAYGGQDIRLHVAACRPHSPRLTQPPPPRQAFHTRKLHETGVALIPGSFYQDKAPSSGRGRRRSSAGVLVPLRGNVAKRRKCNPVPARHRRAPSSGAAPEGGATEFTRRGTSTPAGHPDQPSTKAMVKPS